MKIKNTLLALLCMITLGGYSQVTQKVVIEHFTNSRCSICGSRNPGLYANIDSQNNPDIIHLAVHPSSPYSSCIFSQHDKDANDDRTKYYGVFGSTPKIVINGASVGGSFNTPTLFNPYLNQMSPVSISLSQQKLADSTRIRIVVKTEASHTLGNQKLYVVLAEDTVFYNAPNGEDQHYDVMRRPLMGNTGMTITVPSTVGDSLVYPRTVANHSDWDMSRIYALAILQNESDKMVTQVEAIPPSASAVISGIGNEISKALVKVYPNPIQSELTVTTSEEGESNYRIVSITGKEIETGYFSKQTVLNVQRIPSGIYFITVTTGAETYTEKIIKTIK